MNQQNNPKEFETWQIAKIIVMGFCEKCSANVGMSEINSAIKEIKQVLDRLASTRK